MALQSAFEIGEMEPSVFTEHYFEEMAELEARHPWTKAMGALTLALLEREAGPGLRGVLHAGCGTGLFLNPWLESGPRALGRGGDLYAVALGSARRRARRHWVPS